MRAVVLVLDSPYHSPRLRRWGRSRFEAYHLAHMTWLRGTPTSMSRSRPSPSWAVRPQRSRLRFDDPPPASRRVRWRESFGAKVAVAVLGTVALLLGTTLLIVRFETEQQIVEVVDDATERSRAASPKSWHSRRSGSVMS